MKNRKNMLIYCGGVGIGKTYLCAAMMAHALEHFQTSRAWDMNDLLGKIRSTMDSSGDYLENMKYFIDDDFVIIDDLGNCEMNPWRKDMISYIIDKRYQSARPTVITSNFSIREFSEIFHPRVSSRLFAKENYVIERMDAPDLRQEGM